MEIKRHLFISECEAQALELRFLFWYGFTTVCKCNELAALLPFEIDWVRNYVLLILWISPVKFTGI